MNNDIHVKRVQRPIGQGGFHTAEIRCGRGCFRYVYDCGSQNATEREREIELYVESVPEGAKIDLLAISHLDSDHVNGVDQLLAGIDVKIVLLPYLEVAERIALLAEGAFNKLLTPSYFELIRDPADWFVRRGAERVAFVLPNHGDGDPVFVPDNNHVFDGDLSEQLVLRGLRGFDRSMDHGDIAGKATSNTSVLPGGAPLRLGELFAWWLFAPFTHPEPCRLDYFLDGVRTELGIDVRRYLKKNAAKVFRKFATICKDRDQREKLAHLYERIRADRNLTSMCLYSGPAYDPRKVLQIRKNRVDWEFEDGMVWSRSQEMYPIERYPPPVGWMGTGDAKLTVASRKKAFSNYYLNLLPRVCTFLLPHHGSRSNFTGSLLHDQTQPHSWVVSASTTNTYGHPDPRLMGALKERGMVIEVSEKAESVFVEQLILQR